MQFCSGVDALQSKEETGTHEIHWWQIIEEGEIKAGETLRLDKEQVERKTLLSLWLGAGWLTMNIDSTWRWYSGNKVIIRMCSAVPALAWQVQKMEISLTFHRYLNLDAKRQ